MGLFLSLATFPTLAGVYGTVGRRLRSSGSASALATAGIAVALAGLNTWRLLKRYRLSRPQPLTLVPKLKRPPATGFFIAFEGVEGSGKGTQVRTGRGASPRARGYDVLVTREPGGTDGRRAPPGAAPRSRTPGSSTRAPKRSCSPPPARRPSTP